jgi:hypothetical protein
MYDDLSL